MQGFPLQPRREYQHFHRELDLARPRLPEIRLLRQLGCCPRHRCLAGGGHDGDVF